MWNCPWEPPRFLEKTSTSQLERKALVYKKQDADKLQAMGIQAEDFDIRKGIDEFDGVSFHPPFRCSHTSVIADITVVSFPHAMGLVQFFEATVPRGAPWGTCFFYLKNLHAIAHIFWSAKCYVSPLVSVRFAFTCWVQCAWLLGGFAGSKWHSKIVGFGNVARVVCSDALIIWCCFVRHSVWDMLGYKCAWLGSMVGLGSMFGEHVRDWWLCVFVIWEHDLLVVQWNVSAVRCCIVFWNWVCGPGWPRLSLAHQHMWICWLKKLVQFCCVSLMDSVCRRAVQFIIFVG